MTKSKRSSRIISAGEPNFSEACMATLFNQRTPDQFPNVLYQAYTVADIQQAIQHAKDKNLKISIVSGGHSWSANHMRANTLVIDMSRFDTYTIDKEAMIATAGPGCSGNILMLALNRQNLFFPTGHCVGVRLGGYLLQGGFGWYSQKYGLACESVVGLDVVTADGEIVFASETENSDLFWAARGAGAGFFGVVFRYHLRLYPKPPVIGLHMHIYPGSHLADVLRWAYDTVSEVPSNVEFHIMMTRRPFALGKVVLEVSATAIADSSQEARESLAFMQNSPIKQKAFFRTPFIRTNMWLLYKISSLSFFKEKHRWEVDNMWSHSNADEVLPVLTHAVETMPPHPSVMFWTYWKPHDIRPDMAFSVEDQFYIGMYSGWKKKEKDTQYGSWAIDHIRQLEPFSTGIQLADENLHRRTARFMKNDNMARLDTIREHWDTTNLFNTWHSRPDAVHIEKTDT